MRYVVKKCCVSMRTVFLKIHKKTPVQKCFFSCRPLGWNFVKKRVKRRCFPVFFWKKIKKTVFTDALGTSLRIYSTPPDYCFWKTLHLILQCYWLAIYLITWMYINNSCIISEINLSVIDQVEIGNWKVKTQYMK